MRARTNVTAATAALLLTLTACGSSSSEPSDQTAAIMCEEFVKERLKSPGSAKFPGATDPDYADIATLHDSKPWRYEVAGYVDSDNSFGAKVRNDYVCTISTEDNDTWTLDDMELTER